jgi:lipoprotein-releasing system permease protein
VPATGSLVTVISPEGKLTPLGRTPNTKKFRVTAIFDSGMYEYDASMVYISLSEAQRFLALGDNVTGLELKVKEVYQSDICQKIQKSLGYPYWTKDWKLMNRSLFSALKLEKLTMFIILTMIVLVGALNIISTLVMVVMEKTRDVAILRAMGASARSIMSIFMFQGILVGVIGTWPAFFPAWASAICCPGISLSTFPLMFIIFPNCRFRFWLRMWLLWQPLRWSFHSWRPFIRLGTHQG